MSRLGMEAAKKTPQTFRFGEFFVVCGAGGSHDNMCI